MSVSPLMSPKSDDTNTMDNAIEKLQLILDEQKEIISNLTNENQILKIEIENYNCLNQ